MSRRRHKKMGYKFSLMEETSATTMENLPFEILFKIMADFSIDDLFAVRVVGPLVHRAAGAVLRSRRMRTLMYYDKSLPTTIDNAMLQFLVSNMPLLQTINLGRVTPQAQPLDLDVLAEHCISLRKIDFRRFHCTGRDVIEKLCANCPRLVMSQYGVRCRLYGPLGELPGQEYREALEEEERQASMIRFKKKWDKVVRLQNSRQAAAQCAIQY